MYRIVTSCLVLNGSHSGYRRIIRNLILHLERVPAQEIEVHMLFQEAGWRSLGIDEASLKRVRIVLLGSFRSKWVRGVVEQLYVPGYALAVGADGIFMPATFGALVSPVPVFTFVHTTTSFRVQRSLRGRSFLQQVAHNLLIRATAVTSERLGFTSKITLGELVEFLGVQVQGMVLGNGLMYGVSNDSVSEIDPRIKDGAYILSVSQLYRLKNFEAVMLAFARAKQQGIIPKEFQLVVVGTIQERQYYNELRDLASNIGGVIFLHGIPDAELSALYAHASMYIFMSRFEGFSLTPAEALMSGTKCIISDIPTHREVYGELCPLAPLDDVEALVRAIEAQIAATDGVSAGTVQRVRELFSFDSFFSRWSSGIESLSAPIRRVF